MTIQQLTYLIEISKHRSLSQASQNLYISQQALSLSMRKLEDSVGFQLLKRTHQGVILTEQAKKLVAISENFFAELSNLQKGYSPFELTGTIDLYTTEPLLDNFLAKPLSQLYKIYPKLNIEIHAFSYEKTIQQILQKKLPYCFWHQCYINQENISRDIPQQYEFVPALQAKFFCCVNKNHYLKKYKAISLKSLADHKMIIHSPSQYIFNKIFDYAGIKPLSINVSNTLLIKEMLIANLGVAFSTHSANTFKNFVDFGENIVDIPFEENVVGEIGYLIKKNISLNMDTKFFWIL